MDCQACDSQTVNYIDLIFDTFLELHGDRKSGDDRAVIGGLARLNGYKVVVIGYQRDRSVKTSKAPGPEGYRKCSRLVRLAEAFNKPVILLIDIPAGTSSPASGQQWVDEAVTRYLEEMSCLMTPIIAIVTDESIDMCAADRVLMIEGVGHSVLSLDETSTSGVDTEPLRSDTQDLLNLDVVYRMVKGTLEGDLESTANKLKEAILEELRRLTQMNPNALVQQRLHRLQYQFLHFGTSEFPSGN